MIDPTGMEAEWIPDNDGNLIAEKGIIQEHWQNIQEELQMMQERVLKSMVKVLVMITNLRRAKSKT